MAKICIVNTGFLESYEAWAKQTKGKKRYRVQDDHGYTNYPETLKEANEIYKEWKHNKMVEGVTEDSYVELACSEDDFENYTVLKSAKAVIDTERMQTTTPQEEGYNWDCWTKWEETEAAENERGT